MTGALLGTKLHVPRLRRGSAARPRLMRQMDDGAEARLTLLSAPAGFGKTTVLAAWLQEAGRTRTAGVAWLSRSTPRTTNRHSFWTYVATALRGGGRRASVRERWMSLAAYPGAHRRWSSPRC